MNKAHLANTRHGVGLALTLAVATHGATFGPAQFEPARPAEWASPSPAPAIPLPAASTNQGRPRIPLPSSPIRTNSPPVRATPTNRPPDYWYVAAARLSVRQAPTNTAPLVVDVPRGATVDRLEAVDTLSEGRWFRVRAAAPGGPREGWVASALLAKTVGLATGDFSDMVYGPIPKVSYPDNPRRPVRGIYVSLHTLTSDRFSEILALLRKTSLNGLVIDFKDDEGTLLVPSVAADRMNPTARRESRGRDATARLQQLKAMKIYLIARIVTFKDPIYAREHPDKAILDRRASRPFRSRDGLMWASPYDPDFRAYNLALAEEAAAAGFNEVQFDYVRFPDVSRHANLDYRNVSSRSRAQSIHDFLLEARRRLAPRHVYLAADVFGLITTTVDDMRIGQYWEAVSNVVDYMCPMMYPSHYANNVYGLPIPDQHPFEVVDRGVRDALRRNRNLETPAELRVWLQGFTASWVKGYRRYGPAEVQAQIRAAAAQGVTSYLIWSPSSRYDPAAFR